MLLWLHCTGKGSVWFELSITLFICGNKEFGIMTTLPTLSDYTYKGPILLPG